MKYEIMKTMQGDHSFAITEDGAAIVHLNPGTVCTEENIERVVKILNQHEILVKIYNGEFNHIYEGDCPECGGDDNRDTSGHCEACNALLSVGL